MPFGCVLVTVVWYFDQGCCDGEGCCVRAVLDIGEDGVPNCQRNIDGDSAHKGSDTATDDHRGFWLNTNV